MSKKVATNKNFQEVKEKLKNLLRNISKETDSREIEKLKREFKDIISKANPLIIAVAEGELAQEGYTIDELRNACDVHLELFKEQIENPNLKVPEDHPIHRFQEDHKAILKILETMRKLVDIAKSKNGYKDAKDEINKIEKLANWLMEAENHNIRQENTLFPILERHGIEQPPAIMWAEHVEMKESKKKLLELLKERDKYEFKEFLKLLDGEILWLLEQFASHTQKEENILYVTALDVITDDEWKDIKEECDNLGYFNLNIEELT